jgi:hypothetical protein
LRGNASAKHAEQHLGGPSRQRHGAHGAQLGGTELKAQAKQQQNDAKLGERFNLHELLHQSCAARSHGRPSQQKTRNARLPHRAGRGAAHSRRNEDGDNVGNELRVLLQLHALARVRV